MLDVEQVPYFYSDTFWKVEEIRVFWLEEVYFIKKSYPPVWRSTGYWHAYTFKNKEISMKV